MEQRAGQFFLEAAALLYDDLARRASEDGAAPALRRRRIDSAQRLVELIDRYGDERWDADRARFRADVTRVPGTSPNDDT